MACSTRGEHGIRDCDPSLVIAWSVGVPVKLACVQSQAQRSEFKLVLLDLVLDVPVGVRAGPYRLHGDLHH